MSSATLEIPETLVKPIEAINQTAKQATKSVRRGLEQVENFSDEAALRVRQRPLTAIGIAAGAGLLLGVAVGWLAAAASRRA
ncbi:MAG TPA: hypothetical protein VEU08_11990 [Vicinamibacterales bacterium]|nr:hypothetical protein [Vicinamibacterales bacterium]